MCGDLQILLIVPVAVGQPRVVRTLDRAGGWLHDPMALLLLLFRLAGSGVVC